MRGSCRKLALKKICRGNHQTIFATGTLVPIYATGHTNTVLSTNIKGIHNSNWSSRPSVRSTWYALSAGHGTFKLIRL
jgi:hypothetical protein